ncbi:MAG: methionyl-tRNA formyltransferase [Anaerovoracaceae bacterium]
MKMNKQCMKIVFMGTPDFAVDSLRALAEAGYDIPLVICQPDRPSGRGYKLKAPPVKVCAEELGLTVMQPEKIKENEELFGILRDCGPDFIVVAAYGKIIPKEILGIPKFGCINVHASLLPELRGASPIAASIVSGLSETGVSIMRVEEGLDTGRVYSVRKTGIGRKHTPELTEELAAMGAEALVSALPGIADGTNEGVPQDESRATYAGMIRKQDGRIDFTKTPEQIDCMIRGYDPWPGAYAMLGGRTFKIWDAEPLEGKCDEAPGTVVGCSPDGIDISAGGGILRAKVVQATGKKRMPASEFLKGRNIEKGTVLE